MLQLPDSWPVVTWGNSPTGGVTDLPYPTSTLYFNISTADIPILSTTITEDDVTYEFNYLPQSWVSEIDYTYTETRNVGLVETITLADMRTCVRGKLKYDGDPNLISDDDINDLILEAQNQIVESLKWPSEEVIQAAAEGMATSGTVLSVSQNDTELSDVEVYPTNIDGSNYSGDLTVKYLPVLGFIFLPETLAQCLCLLSAALWLDQIDSPRANRYHQLADDRIRSFRSALNSRSKNYSTTTKSIWGS